MSLPTPPNTSHRREKENIEPCFTRVVWSTMLHQYHSLNSPPKAPPTSTSASKPPPTRSILKKRSPILIFPPPTDKPREITPEPSDPLVDLLYLENPVKVIVSYVETVRGRIEAYSVLTARLRACVAGDTDVDASWPLLQPLRKNRDAFVRAVVRDIGRALEDPAYDGKTTPSSPVKKRKDGMSAEQVTHARDVCTLCHCVIRLLSLALVLPALQNIFTESELSSILATILTIPLAPDLPTPNARKTYALAIWLIQVQRLPAPVLAPAADRIAFALRRAVEGELGKEGKKGSTSDGLKAIHDLSTYLPNIFIPAFIPILPSLLSLLLAPTLTLRTQAAQAVSGFVLGLLQLPPPTYHAVQTRISSIVAEFLTTRPTPARDPPIIRTLRTTLVATAPTHAAHGPVWALPVLAALVVLLGPRVVCDPALGRTVGALAGLGMGHGRSSVRALACLMWRTLVWAWFTPVGGQGDAEAQPGGGDEEGESEVDEGDAEREERREKEKARKVGHDTWWKVVKSVVELQTGATIIHGLVARSNPEEEGDKQDRERWRETRDEPLKRSLELLNVMMSKNEQTTSDAIDTLKQLVGAGSYPPAEGSADDESTNTSKGNGGWDPTTLVPRALFTDLPALMGAEFKALAGVVRPMFDETVGVDDIRRLSEAEIMRGWDESSSEASSSRDGGGRTQAWMWEGLVEVWRKCLGRMGEFGTVGEGQCQSQNQIAYVKDLVAVWEGLVRAGVRHLEGHGEAIENGMTIFAGRVVDLLVSILSDGGMELTRVKTTRVNMLVLPTSSYSSPTKTEMGVSPKSKVKSMKPKGGSSPTTVPIPALNFKRHSPPTDIELELLKPAANASPAPNPNSNPNPNAALRLKLVRRLWATVRGLVPAEGLVSAAERMLVYLMKNEEYLTDSCPPFAAGGSMSLGARDDSMGEAGLENAETVKVWAELCVDVLVVCGVEALRAFWGYRWADAEAGEEAWEWSWSVPQRVVVWKSFLDRWAAEGAGGVTGWEGCVCLLGVPFMDQNAWDLTKEDVKLWHEVLDQTVNRALDYGVDATTVLDTLARCVASHNAPISSWSSPLPHISPGAKATRLVELLMTQLGHHITDAREVPEGVLDFVGETLREAYPPLSSLTVKYTWAVRAVVEVIEKCPRDLVGGLLAGIAEGLSLWIGDSCEAWSESELAYDVVPLYQHILIRIQELPLELETLETFADIIEAPFSGRDEVLPAFAEAFVDFWKATFAGVQKPTGGWPEGIRNCIRIAMGPLIVDVSPPTPTLAPAFAPSLPCTPSRGVSEFSELNFPVRPRTPTTPSLSSTPQVATPPRPQKLPTSSFTFFAATGNSPGSPIRSSIAFPIIHSSPKAVRRVPTTPKRTPRSVTGSLSTKRRKIEEADKENESPSSGLTIRSVTERIAMSSKGDDEPWIHKPAVLGKRHLDDEDLAARPSLPKKRRGVSRAEDTDSEDEKDMTAVAKDLFAVTASPPLANTITRTLPLPKKRKRIIMDAVEVPGLREVYPRLRYSSSFESLSMGSRSPFVLRQTRSVTRATLATSVTYSNSTKRRRASATDVFSSSPLRALEIPGSDSFSLREIVAMKATGSSDTLSSDDDPHIGQVTPHHLISPELRRRAAYEDPPSDDSVMCASPSRDVAERRLQRLGSFNGLLKPIPFVI